MSRSTRLVKMIPGLGVRLHDSDGFAKSVFVSLGVHCGRHPAAREEVFDLADGDDGHACLLAWSRMVGEWGSIAKS